MACIYLYVAAYSFSWGPLSWIYIAEYVQSTLIN